MPKILLVDDDTDIVDLLSELLVLEGFRVDVAYDGLEALDKLDSSYSIVLLDVMMPKLDGIETLKRIRQCFSLPVLMLTARGDDMDRIQGLELGADDYLPKPFNDRELIARIKAILRRTGDNTTEDAETKVNPTNKSHLIEFEGVELDTVLQQASYQGVNLELTGSEFLLLQTMIVNAGNPLTRDYLTTNALGKKLVAFDRTVDMHMSNLRKKLPERKNQLPWFKTLRGRGYILLINE